MATPSGLSAQFGYKAETSYGTPATPVDVFVPLRSEAITDGYGRIVADDIIAGAETTRQSQVASGNLAVAGSVDTYLLNRSLTALFAKLLGSSSTAGVGPYTHTITPGDQTGDSVTAQIGRPDMGGTVRPFTYTGVKVRGVTVGASQGEFATASWDLIAKDIDTSAVLADYVEAAGLTRMRGDELTVTIDGTPLEVYSFELTIASPLDDSLRPVGQSTIREPLRNDHLAVSGSLDLRWTDLTNYDRVADLTFGTLVATFTSGDDSLKFTSDVHFDQADQPVAGRGVIRQTITYAAAGDANDADTITIEAVNDDTTA